MTAVVLLIAAALTARALWTHIRRHDRQATARYRVDCPEPACTVSAMSAAALAHHHERAHLAGKGSASQASGSPSQNGGRHG